MKSLTCTSAAFGDQNLEDEEGRKIIVCSIKETLMRLIKLHSLCLYSLLHIK